MSLLQIVDSITRPVCARVVYVTDYETLKKGRDGAAIPAKLQGLRRIVSRVVNIGNDYTKAVCNQIVKGGEDPKKWETDAHAWAEVDPTYKSGNVYRSRKNPDQKYVRIYEDMSVKGAEGSLFNPATGDLVSVSWEEMINFSKKNPESAGSQKQEDHGVAKEVKFRLVKAENVKFLQAGERVHSDLTPYEAAALVKLVGPKL